MNQLSYAPRRFPIFNVPRTVTTAVSVEITATFATLSGVRIYYTLRGNLHLFFKARKRESIKKVPKISANAL